MTIAEQPHTAIIALGSNIEPELNIQKALTELSRYFNVKGQSCFTKTKPIGYLNQPDFLNGAILIETTTPLEKIKIILQDIEQEQERVKTENCYGPRTIDLDIIIWDNQVIHHDYDSRDFVRTSVQEITVAHPEIFPLPLKPYEP